MFAHCPCIVLQNGCGNGDTLIGSNKKSYYKLDARVSAMDFYRTTIRHKHGLIYKDVRPGPGIGIPSSLLSYSSVASRESVSIP